MLSVYKVLSFLLLPVAFLLAMIVVPGIFIGIANPQILLSVFFFACVVIYTYCSFAFMRKGLMRNQVCRRSLKDWIKVNAYVSVLVAIELLVGCVGALIRPEMIQENMRQVYDSYAAQGLVEKGITEESIFRFFRYMIYFMLVYGALLLTHIILSFILIKRYADRFADNQ